MLNPDDARFITGIEFAIVALFLGRMMWWQVRVGLVDRQAKSAFIFVMVLTTICIQYALSYLGFFSFGNTDRGPLFLLVFLLALMWWNTCTERHNVAVLREIERHKRALQLRNPLDAKVDQHEGWMWKGKSPMIYSTGNAIVDLLVLLVVVALFALILFKILSRF
jgi:hypothetical protein